MRYDRCEQGDSSWLARQVRRAKARPGEATVKELELKNSRLRKAVSDLTLAKLILTEALDGT
jgi:hypothetical protein